MHQRHAFTQKLVKCVVRSSHKWRAHATRLASAHVRELLLLGHLAAGSLLPGRADVRASVSLAAAPSADAPRGLIPRQAAYARNTQCRAFIACACDGIAAPQSLAWETRAAFTASSDAKQGTNERCPTAWTVS